MLYHLLLSTTCMMKTIRSLGSTFSFNRYLVSSCIHQWTLKPWPLPRGADLCFFFYTKHLASWYSTMPDRSYVYRFISQFWILWRNDSVLFIFLVLIQGLLQPINSGLLKVVIIMIIIISKIYSVIPYIVRTQYTSIYIVIQKYLQLLFEWCYSRYLINEKTNVHRQKQDFYISYFNSIFFILVLCPNRNITVAFRFYPDLFSQKFWSQGLIIWNLTGPVGDIDAC